MWIILILVVVCGPQQSHSQVQLTSTLQSEEGDQVTLSCGLTGTYTFPAWRGPPLLMVYTNLGDTSGNINPAAPAESRLQYATNNQDLLLSSSSTNDSGVYKCSYTALGDHTITLTVTEKVIQGPGPGKRCWCVCKDEGWKCFICWLIIILVVDIIIGLIMGCSMIYQPGCLDCEASDCSGCCKCCDKDIIRCKCCCWYIKSAPFWYYILWWTVIGTPVAFVIFIILKLKQPGNGNVDAKCEDPKFETQSGNTRTGQKKSEIKNKSKISAQTENEQGRKSREQPPIPLVAQITETTMSGREDSDSAVSREHVKLQDSDRTLPLRPMPDIPRKSDRQGHDSKGRGLSANFSDDDHPLVSIDIPLQKKGALDALPEGTGGEEPVKKKKKKKKKQEEDEE